jgi:hypothetical protein
MTDDDTNDTKDELANAVAAAIADAQEDGLGIVETLSVALCAVADYARIALGDDILEAMAKLVKERRGKPIPDIQGKQ